MILDIGGIIGIIFSGLVLVGGCLLKFHIRKCHTLCIDSDCREGRSPVNSSSTINAVDELPEPTSKSHVRFTSV